MGGSTFSDQVYLDFSAQVEVYAFGIGLPKFVWVGPSLLDYMCSNPSELPVECGKFCERSDDLLRLFLNENVQDCRGNVRFLSIRVVSEEGLFEGVPIRWCGMKLR